MSVEKSVLNSEQNSKESALLCLSYTAIILMNILPWEFIE
jgi:hypothetical protein